MQPILPPRMTTAITSKEDANTLYNPSSPSCQLSLPSLPSLAAYPSATAESAWLFISFSFSLQVSISSFKMHFLLYSESQSYYLKLPLSRAVSIRDPIGKNRADLSLHIFLVCWAKTFCQMNICWLFCFPMEISYQFFTLLCNFNVLSPFPSLL